MLLRCLCLVCSALSVCCSSAGEEWLVDGSSNLDSEAWPGKDWTQVLEQKDNRKVTSWSPLGRLSSPEVFGNEEDALPSPPQTPAEKSKGTNDSKKGSGGGGDANKILKTSSPPGGRTKAKTGGTKNEVTMTTAGLKDLLGPGMGGSAVEGIADTKGQKFATEPAPQTAVVGSIVVLPCRVVNKVGQLQWTKDGFGLGTERNLFGFSRYSMIGADDEGEIGADDEGDFSLRIQPVLLEDDGTFQCQVSASDGVPGIRSKSVQLTVYVPPEPPVVTPERLESTAGLLATLQCTSRGGRPPPEIQWVDKRHPREPLGLGAVITMELMEDNKRAVVTSKLSFTPRRTHDNTTIACLTSNQALTSPLSSLVSLHVRYAPEVQVTVDPTRLVEGDEARLTCHAVANPPLLTYRWYHNRMLVDNQTSSTLVLRRISREMHQDSISCEVSNKVGTSKKTRSLHVRFGPVFRSEPQDVAAELQNEVLLKCDVDSNPAASIIWQQEGADKIIGTGAELRVVVSPSTTGQYRCVASVRERELQFPELVGRLRVLVKGPPTIVSSGEQMGRPGGTVKLECNTVSVPSPIKVTWTYKGRAVDLDDPRYEVKEQQRDEGLRTILVIHDAEETDFGDYNCSVVNEYGIARKLIRLNEEKRVPLLLVYGGGGVLLLAIVVVASLVLCNKRSAREKVHEKVTISSNSGAPNMYSAASDPRLTEHMGSSEPLSRTQDTALTNQPIDDTTLTRNNNTRRELPRVTRLRDESTQDRESMFSHETLHEEESSGFLPLLDVARHDPSRLESASDTPPAPYRPSPVPPGMEGAELCTLRRANKGPDLTEPYRNGNVMRNNAENSRLNHERYTNYCGYAASPPPPPPYPRPQALGAKQSPASTASPPQSGPDSGMESVGVGVAAIDSSYIFSPEAMMKPGTLV